MLDEFQYVKDGGKKLKLLFDTYPQAKYIISGSSSLDLLAKAGKFLVGRLLTFPLYPLTFSEFLQYKDKKIFKQAYYPHAKIVENLHMSQKPEKDIILHPFITKRVNLCLKEFLLYGGYPRIAISKNPKIKKNC